MNERIKELVKLAWQQRDLVTPTRAMDDAFTDKFAELIVRECADIAGYYYTRNECVSPRQIKQHFGVEE